MCPVSRGICPQALPFHRRWSSVPKGGSNKALGLSGINISIQKPSLCTSSPIPHRSPGQVKENSQNKANHFYYHSCILQEKKKEGCNKRVRLHLKKKNCRFVHVLFTPRSRLSPTSGTATALVRGPFADAALGTLGIAHGAAGAAAWGREGGGTDEPEGQRIKKGSRPFRWRRHLPRGRGTHCPI